MVVRARTAGLRCSSRGVLENGCVVSALRRAANRDSGKSAGDQRFGFQPGLDAHYLAGCSRAFRLLSGCCCPRGLYDRSPCLAAGWAAFGNRTLAQTARAKFPTRLGCARWGGALPLLALVIFLFADSRLTTSRSGWLSTSPPNLRCKSVIAW